MSAEERPLAVVCLSGGMDSCVTAAIAAQDYRLALLHVDYGQRTAARERASFLALADHFGATHRLVTELPALRAIGGSSLTDSRVPVREGHPRAGLVPSSYVPFRNTQILGVAVAWAEVLPASAVYIGAVWEDSSGYPDCRPEFYRAFNEVVRLGTRPGSDIRVVTPVIDLSKAEIVRRGAELGAPFAWTWSCYQDSEVACGRCESCILRREAFARAGLDDPIPYQAPLGT